MTGLVFIFQLNVRLLTFPVFFFFFSRLAGNDRGYAHLRFAGVFTFARRKSVCAQKPATCKLIVN